MFAYAQPGWGNDLVLPYQLELFVNGQATKTIVGFGRDDAGRFKVQPADLVAVRINVPETLRKQDLVPLEMFCVYQYDEAKQEMHLVVPGNNFIPEKLDATSEAARTEPARSDTGAALNYGIVLNGTETLASGVNGGSATRDFNVSLNLDSRYFTPDGLFKFGALTGTGLPNDAPLTRLDTFWEKVDEATLTNWRVGDAIQGTLAWTRPVRYGGFQYQRDFALRPDLVTLPLPVVTGTAAVPSTVDIYVDNVKTYSKDVAAGPFTISNVPVVGNGGLAKIVVRDASGRVTESSTPFYSAPKLLKAGLFDYSLDVGLPRTNYGTSSFDYDTTPVAAASARYGWTEKLTLESHGEVGYGVVNGGFGTVFPVTQSVLLSTAAMASSSGGALGGRIYAGAEWRSGSYSIGGTLDYSSTDYLDVSAASTRNASAVGNVYAGLATRYTALLSLSAPAPFTDGSINLTVIDSQTQAGDERQVVNAGYSQKLTNKAGLSFTATYDLTERAASAYLGVTMQLGERQTASIGGTASNSGTRGATLDYAQLGDGKPGSFGWRTSVTRGDGARVSGNVSYVADIAQVDAMAVHAPTSTFATATVNGAFVWLGGEMHATRSVADGMAIVDVGYPGVEVSAENRPIGKTDANGRIFVPNLVSHQYNTISIDPTVLPVDVQPSEVKKKVVPMRGSGIVVDMKVKPAPSSALVEFVLPDGNFVPPGVSGKVVATGEEFQVGFDGQGFISALADRNEVVIELEEATCKASFPLTAKPGQQVFVEKVVCK